MLQNDLRSWTEEDCSGRNQGRKTVIRLTALVATCILMLQVSVGAEQPQAPASSPADYVLVTVILRHDQSRNLEEITKLQEESGYWTKFPPEGIIVESWYVAMGLGQIVTLRVPPARLREVNRSIEQNAWKVYRTEIYPTYDFREIAQTLREKALKK